MAAAMAAGNAPDHSQQSLLLQVGQPTMLAPLPSPAQCPDSRENIEPVTVVVNGLPQSALQGSSGAASVDWAQANVSSKVSPGGRSRDSKSSADEAKRSKTKAGDDIADHSPSSDGLAAKKQAAKEPQRDPYSTDEALDRFVNDVERYEKVVASLCKPSLSGPTPLEKEWKELADEQDRQSRKLFMAVGLSESMRNRCPDMIPYDKWRVVLTGLKNDYINASLIENLPAPAPNVIATQGPLPQTVQDFWTMVFQQDCEVIAMLSKYEDQDQSETMRYWPKDRQDSLTFGDYQVSLHLMNTHKHWVERRLIVTALKTRQTKAVTQLQYTAVWPSSSGLGSAAQRTSPQPLFMFANEVHTFHRQQRNSTRPVVVHCSNGTTKTGTFLALYCGMLHISTGQGIGADFIPRAVSLLRARRKWCVTCKEDLLFCYTAILYYAEDLLMKRGILTNKASFGNPLPSPGGASHVRKPSDDFRSATSLADLNQSVEKMLGKKEASPSQQPPPADGCSSSSVTTAVAVRRKDQEGSTEEAHTPFTAVASASAAPGSRTASSEVAAAAAAVSAMAASVSVSATSGGSKAPSACINGTHTSPASLDGHTGVLALQRGQAEQRGGAGGGGQLGVHAPAAATAGGPPPAGTDGLQQQPSLPLQSILDIQNPETFNLGSTGVKKRITKADFLAPQTKLTDSQQPSDASDPLASLDPLWSFAVK